MACIRKRRGKYVVDYRDSRGVRHWQTCKTREAANDVLSEKLREVKMLKGVACADPNITVADLYDAWIQKVEQISSPRTFDTYSGNFRLHILPELGDVKVKDLRRPRIKSLLVGKLKEGYAKGTIRLINAGLRAMLNEAVEEGIIFLNPALKIGKTLKVEGQEAKKGRKEPKAFTREQLAGFLANAHPRWFPYFLFLARTGLRLGESLAVGIPDILFDSRQILVNKAISKGKVQMPKDGESRDVDLSSQLADVLKAMIAERKRRYFSAGKPMPDLLFPTENGGVMNRAHIIRAIQRTLGKANLPMHFSAHSFRHTFASQLLQMGESPAYVQRQLGHSSIKMTVDTYGKWLPAGNKNAVDRLDAIPQLQVAQNA
jgi:integrase